MQVRFGSFLSSVFAICVLLFAFVGNARIFGVDVVLMAITPACMMLFALSAPRFSERGIVIGVFVSLLGYIAVLLALRYDMLLGHVFWPIKAVLLALFVGYVAPKVRAPQIHLLALLVVVFIVTSADEYGRSYGLFGPNMLYRFYGLLFLGALYLIATQQRRRLVWSVYMIVALSGIIQTGSVGGILLVAIGATFFVRFSFKSLAAFAIVGIMITINWQRLQNVVVVQRLLFKMTQANMENSSRIDGARQILAEGLVPLGHPYETFDHVWRPSFGYPHNIVVELISFYGVLGIIVSVILMCALVIVRRRIYERNCGLFDLAYIALLVGTLLSGDLSDNYGTVGLAISIVVLSLFQNHKRQTYPQSGCGVAH